MTQVAKESPNREQRVPTYESSKASYPNYRKASKKKPSLFLSILLTISALVSAVFIAMQSAKINKIQLELNDAKQKLTANSNELSVLRAISPYEYDYKQLLTKITELDNLSPGWGNTHL